MRSCANCHEDYSLRDGCDPTRYCDACAHTLLEQMEHALGLDRPWPVQDVLIKLADAADLLLGRHNYDGHGWEEIGRARDEARRMADDLRRS